MGRLGIWGREKEEEVVWVASPGEAGEWCSCVKQVRTENWDRGAGVREKERHSEAEGQCRTGAAILEHESLEVSCSVSWVLVTHTPTQHICLEKQQLEGEIGY